MSVTKHQIYYQFQEIDDLSSGYETKFYFDSDLKIEGGVIQIQNNKSVYYSDKDSYAGFDSSSNLIKEKVVICRNGLTNTAILNYKNGKVLTYLFSAFSYVSLSKALSTTFDKASYIMDQTYDNSNPKIKNLVKIEISSV